MAQRVRIALDAMGGDFGVPVVVPAAVEFLREDPGVELILVGREELIRRQLDGLAADVSRLRVRHASEEVGMDELPSRALRNKKDSSMRVAIDLVKRGEADACVSAGNTGALMATARFVLKTLPLIDRPAIMTALPSMRGRTWVLDLGANVDCTAEHLFQFAVMGAEAITAVAGVERPKVGLLNIGQEEIKGNEQVKQAHELLAQSSLHYVGYVEGDGIYDGEVDLVVTDGFVGNVALKSSEGVARMIRQFLREGFRRNPWNMIAGFIALPVLKSISSKIDPRRYNGASLLGLRGIVIKSHGGADTMAFKNAIRIAEKAVHTDIPNRIARQVEAQLEQRVSA